MSAITESQVHTEGGLHRPVACADGSGYQHRYKADGSQCDVCVHNGVMDNVEVIVNYMFMI